MKNFRFSLLLASWPWILISLLLLTGCAPTPRDAGHKVVGISNAPHNLDPRIGFDQASSRAHSLLFDALFELDENLMPAPQLAQSFSWRDPKTLDITLRNGVTFHDGRPLESEDVAHTLDSIRLGEVVSFRKADLEVIESIEVIDALHLVLHLSHPSAPLLANMNVGIVPRDAGDNFAENPVGSGPFKLLEHVPGQWLRLSPNTEHYSGGPALTQLDLKIVGDDTVRALELKKGTIDAVISDLPPDLVWSFAQDDKFTVIRSPGINISYVAFQVEDPALADVRVRQALVLATDRDLLLTHLMRGLGQKADSLLPPFHWSTAPPKALPFDLERAETLLTEAGLPRPKDGSPRLSITMKTSNSQSSTLIGQALQQQWSELGVELKLDSREWGSFFKDVRSGSFQVTTLTWVGITDPDAYRLRFGSRYIPPENPGGLNRGHYRNEIVDVAVEEALSETDQARRQELYAQVQEQLEKDLPYMFLWFKDNTAVVRKGAGSFKLLPQGSFRALAGWQ